MSAISADQIADAIAQHRPTAEQRAVIEAPLGPALVVAGAGSGKTETMSARVLWLVANGLVRPEQILGLTFTRKAAGELAQRIRERLGALGRSGLLGAQAVGTAPAPLVDAFTQPTVSTYNAFASSLYRDHAVLIGRDPDGVVLGEASAWQLARDLVTRADDERLIGHDLTVDRLTTAVLALAHGLSEHVADVDALRLLIESMAGLVDLPPGGRGAYPDVDRLVDALAPTLPVADLVEAFQTSKRRDGLVEFSDQVALALEIVGRHPAVAEEHRERFRVVLLDEYQDTNVAQTRLLSELFGGQPVMAVGDPHQSIYGWRGASATNLDDFAERFALGDGTEVPRFSLSTSWRNGHRILDVANALVEPLTARGGVPVDRLTPGPTASDHGVELSYPETLDEEADAVARWLGERLRPASEEAPPPTAALLMRNRSTQPVFLEAMRRHGIPFHVLGIGGLLAQPEIADLVSALAVVDDPAAGTELVRLLAGPRWSIGLADLDALRDLAEWLRHRDLAQRAFSDEVRQRMRDSVAASEGVSLVDALDFVATAPDDHGRLAGISAVGRQRMREAGALFARLRRHTALDLPDLVAVVEQELLLDIEVAANPHRVLRDAPRDAFLDALDGYRALADHATLGGFLSWLREAEWRDNLSPRSEDPEPGTVQVLTIHGSKGLEWDHVAVPRFVEQELPSRSRDGTTGWLKLGVLPYELRGDAAELPVFAWRGAETRKDLLARKEEFSSEVGAHLEREERRLAYVAVTRARHRLLLSGSFWSTQTAPRKPSPFLVPLAERGLLPTLPEATEHETNPLVVDEPDEPWWPQDPLGARRELLHAAAARVRAASPTAGTSGSAGEGTNSSVAVSAERADPFGWQRSIDLLLAEREERRRGRERVEVPYRVPASAFKDYVTTPDEVAERLRRPVPQRPYRATRLGTVFHRWVENRFGLGALTDAVDGVLVGGADESSLDEAVGDGYDPARLAELQATFESSPWATRQPVDVEREIHLPFAGRLIICKIDAVYPARLSQPDGSEVDGVEIVDWKTGRAPRGDDDRAAKELQLALYRLAYSRYSGRPLSEIGAAFYFVADDTVLRPESLPDEADLVAQWAAAVSESPPSA